MRNVKRRDNDNGDDITMESLTGHLEEKFRPSSVNKDTICTSKSCMENAEKMDMHYQNIKGKIYNAEFNLCSPNLEVMEINENEYIKVCK